jgi:hypothetical protein
MCHAFRALLKHNSLLALLMTLQPNNRCKHCMRVSVCSPWPGGVLSIEQLRKMTCVPALIVFVLVSLSALHCKGQTGRKQLVGT